ncbi:PAAR domain-containing protein [Noviherbaspirillum saxi]|uniref:Zn-binding Pro-Ala-Ala-Arg (PAAR) domain-containing protein, incolved in TypeVI secretion n=1 Tax=Noviherbaspirillum saxi TaxID=2320863 RepID=A0A3A3FXR3_9BURK|nr:PAAR domain-containing protein [Noviherbaspirillum saxi]RJF99468.1 hypothetical protein D3871_13735 [Noviherbaspirillum saxi]
MTQAARLGDPIGHSPSMSWLLRGLLIGAGIAVVGVALVGTGGLAAAAIIGGAAAFGAGLGDLFSTMSWAPKEVCGAIVGACSANVFTNGLRAGRAHIDIAHCSKHSNPHPLIATGSPTVFINGLPAARVSDKISCGAVITGGSNNVFIGGGVTQTDPITPEHLVPGRVHGILFLIGGASAVALAGPVVAIGGLIAGAAGGKLGEVLGGKVFGAGSDGEKWSLLAGSLVGGFAGAKAAPKTWGFAKRVTIDVQPGTLGMSGGNIKIDLKPSTGRYKVKKMDGKYMSENEAENSVWPGRQVTYLSESERAEYRLVFKDGKAYEADGSLFDTTDTPNGKAIFVMDGEGNFFAYKYAEVGEFHHSSFLAGKPVAAAGELTSYDGLIVEISNKSGHYKPSVDFLLQAMNELENKGVSIESIFPDIYSH